MRKFLSFGIVLVFSVVSAVVPADAAVKIGDSCKSAGQTTTVNGSVLTCTKSGAKLIWSKSVKADSYDAAFAAAILSEAQEKADQVLADAELSASQISTPPNCAVGSTRALVTIGGDPSTGVIALIYENPGICDLVVRASAEFYCPRGRSGNNTVISRATFALKARAKIYVSLSPERYFPMVIVECRQLTGYTSNTISVANELTRRSNPTVNVESSKYSGVFNQAEATKKANQILKSAQSRAKQIIADAKNPVLIAKAWSRKTNKATAEKVATDKAAIEKVAADKIASIVCIPNSNCPIGSTGPGGGIVFYDAGSQKSWGRYLEVAPAGWSGTATDPYLAWSAKPPLVMSDGKVFKGSCYEAFCEIVPGIERSITANNDTSGIGLGYKNSNAILEQGNFATTAAGVARAYSGGGQSDWFLPSTAELNLLCQWARNVPQNVNTRCKGGVLNTGKGANGGFNNISSHYWSSSEADFGNAWIQFFVSGSQSRDSFKGDPSAVRPIRAFPFDKTAADKAVADAARGVLPGEGKACVPSSFCPLGSTGPGGGIVFYDAGSQQSWGRYLEAAPTGWSGTTTDPKKNWCNVTGVHFAATITDVAFKANIGAEIGKGKANTSLMMANCSSGAGHAAQTYQGGGKSDWFLPSRDELNELCKYAKFLPTGLGGIDHACPTKPDCRPLSVLCQSPLTLREGFAAVFPWTYWSSSETGNGTAWHQDFATKYLTSSKPKSDGTKWFEYYVRPIRAF